MTLLPDLIKAMLLGSESVLGSRVTYTDVSTGSSWRIQATLGRSVREDTDYAGNSLEETTVDFIVRLSEMRYNGTTIFPGRGDTITYNGTTYTVLPDGTEQTAGWGWTDNSRSSIRIHTKEI